MENVKSFLNKKFLEWESQFSERKTLKEFAIYLGIKPTTLNNWLNSPVPPSEENIRRLSIKLGLEIYDVMDLPRPPKMIREIEEIYQTIPSTHQSNFDDELDKWLSDWLSSHGYKRIK